MLTRFSQKSVSPSALCVFWRHGYVLSRQINTIFKKRKPFDRSSSKVYNESWYYFPFRPVFKRKIYSPFSFIYFVVDAITHPPEYAVKYFEEIDFFFTFFFFSASTFLTKSKKFWTELLHDVYLVEIFHPLSCTSLRLEFFIAPGAHFYGGSFSFSLFWFKNCAIYFFNPPHRFSLGVIYGVERNTTYAWPLQEITSLRKWMRSILIAEVF